MTSAIERARAWLRGDPDERDRAELEALIGRAEAGFADAREELVDRFSGPLRFGTAGLRGLIGGGESRMNRAVVIRATAGLVAYLQDVVPQCDWRGLVVGRDGRRRSDDMQRDAAEVAAAAGMKVWFLPGTSPTPLVAFAVKELRASAGVAVTASHNPPAYNGYKVYFENGAQIIPPHDEGIAARIDATPEATSVPRRSFEDARAAGLIVEPEKIEEKYVAALLRLLQVPDAPRDRVRIAYTALHGVGERLFRTTLGRAGFTQIDSVAEQAEPDGAFPTVKFPNPEEPEAMARVLALAKEKGSDLVLANDPDADRLAVAVRDGAGEYQVLSGNEIGVLLAHHLLTTDPSPDPQRVVITTLVSSAQLKRIAKDLGAQYAETLTGFKWIANRALELERREGMRFVFGYEEALGYTAGTVTRDKDGIGAALVFAELAAVCKAAGQTVLDRLRDIRKRHGLYVSRQKSVTLAGLEGAAQIAKVMKHLRAAPPAELAGTPIASAWDLLAEQRAFADGRVEHVNAGVPADVLVYELADGSRAAVRPSGTEPKIKFYLEVAETSTDDMDAATARANERLDGMTLALMRAAGL